MKVLFTIYYYNETIFIFGSLTLALFDVFIYLFWYVILLTELVQHSQRTFNSFNVNKFFLPV